MRALLFFLFINKAEAACTPEQMCPGGTYSPTSTGNEVCFKPFPTTVIGNVLDPLCTTCTPSGATNNKNTEALCTAAGGTWTTQTCDTVAAATPDASCQIMGSALFAAGKQCGTGCGVIPPTGATMGCTDSQMCPTGTYDGTNAGNSVCVSSSGLIGNALDPNCVGCTMPGVANNKNTEALCTAAGGVWTSQTCDTVKQFTPAATCGLMTLSLGTRCCATGGSGGSPTVFVSNPCFPSTALVLKPDGKRARIDTLKEGDAILSATTDGTAPPLHCPLPTADSSPLAHCSPPIPRPRTLHMNPIVATAGFPSLGLLLSITLPAPPLAFRRASLVAAALAAGLCLSPLTLASTCSNCSAGALVHDTVSLLSIAQPEARAPSYVTLTTTAHHNLTLTEGHHLPVGQSCCSTLKKAADVTVGETVWVVKAAASGDDAWGSHDLSPMTLIAKTKTKAHGLHSPVLTNGGMPVVDGIVTAFDSFDKVMLAKYGLVPLLAACNATGTCAKFRDTFLGDDKKYIS